MTSFFLCILIISALTVNISELDDPIAEEIKLKS